MPLSPTPRRRIGRPTARGILLLGLWSSLFVSCRDGAPQARAGAAALERQIAALRELVAAADKGALFPPDQLAVGVKAELVRDLLQRHLPLETVVADRFRLRLETADIAFENGQSLVLLTGRVSASEDPTAFADVQLRGGLHRLAVDAQTGILTAHVDLDGVEARRLGAGSVERGVSDVITEGLGGRSLGALGQLLPTLAIPVRLDQAIEFGGFSEGPVSIRPKRLPVHVSVARIMPVAGRLWILLDLSTEAQSAPSPPRPRP